MSATIFVSLLGEGTPVWRPVSADHIREDVYRIVSSPFDDTETWQFIPGDTVRCREQTFTGGETGLAAYERITNSP
jgi:hypothetical protein